MTNRSNDAGKHEELSFEELVAQSSVGGATDPLLDSACTNDEAITFAAKYVRSQSLLEECRSISDLSSSESSEKENDSEIRRVDTLRGVWPELATYVRNHLCDDRTVIAEIMHEAAADFTQYWREKGELDREGAIALLRHAAKRRATTGRYKIRLCPENVGVLLDLD